MVKSVPVSRTDRQLAWLLLALVAALYLRTMAPGLLDGDAGEFQTAAWRFGLAHATGYPLYLLIGGLWQHLLALLGVAPATALNAFSAVTAALAIATFYLLLVGWLPGGLVARRFGALFAALLLAANPTFWSQALIAEVYALHCLLLVAILWQFRRYAELHRLAAESFPPAPLLVSSERRVLTTLAALIGLALTHHGLTLLLLPALGLAITVVDRTWWRSGRTVAGMVLAASLPLALYLYIPLRSGPAASPWYHQPWGESTLALYEQSWRGLLDFVTGRSISVGFHGLEGALANLSQAWLLWRIHFTPVGLVLLAGGLYALWRQRNWPLLALTVGYAPTQQIFNLFYAIGDILVYYIPLYLIGAIWCAFAINALVHGGAPRSQEGGETPAPPVALTFGLVAALACVLLPISILRDYYSRLDQAGATAAAEQWQAILAAQPPANAILVSNDRNEIVPLFYWQAVDGEAQGVTGLFPLIKSGDDFIDIGATVASALHANPGRPVYLIKPMPGLEVRFALEPATPPLVRVVGERVAHTPRHPVMMQYGPLHLLGYDWERLDNATVAVTLYWRVDTRPDADYTTTVQLFAGQGEKIAQDDRPPGGVYYPTSYWKPGELLVARHELTLPAEGQPTHLQVSMYAGPALTLLAPPLTFDLTVDE